MISDSRREGLIIIGRDSFRQVEAELLNRNQIQIAFFAASSQRRSRLRAFTRMQTCSRFLDIRPLFPGHVLLCPRSALPHIAGPARRNSSGRCSPKRQLLTKAVEIALEAEGTFLAINNRISQSVPHLHLHIVPRRRKGWPERLFWPRTKYQDAEAMEAVRAAIERQARKLTGPNSWHL